MNHIGVVGAGAWGTALAQVAARAGRQVTLWARRAELAARIERERANPDYLPGIDLDPAIRAVADPAALASADALLLVTPAQRLREVAAGLPATAAPLVICAKGLEAGSGALLGQVVGEVCPGRSLAVLSGPSFAAEVAAGLPTAVTLATADAALGRALVEALGSRSFRPYWSDDLVGVQVGGAVKNVLAIAAGIVIGLGLGENARAALITRGLAELGRLGRALGARAETLSGLSGLGDLMLTANSMQSRNTSLGARLGQGATLAEILAGRHSVTEGVASARPVLEVAARHGVELPICAAVDAVLEGRLTPAEAAAALLERPFRAERGVPPAVADDGAFG